MQAHNSKALYDALKKIHDLVNSLDENCGVDPIEVRDIAREALAKPVRNCDVGTADDKIRRFRDHCLKVEKPGECMYCHNPPVNLIRCVMEWMQLPYSEGTSK